MVTNGNIRNLKYMINFVVMVFIDINVDFEWFILGNLSENVHAVW